MPGIHHDVPIRAPIDTVFDGVSTPEGLDVWWSSASSGERAVGSQYRLHFGPDYEWRAIVTRCRPPLAFELEMIASDADWQGTRVGFDLVEKGDHTLLRFRHEGWPDNDHYRQSSYCWATYLRCLKRYLERGERVAYADRFDA